MSNYRVTYKNRCISCGVEVPVLSTNGCHFKVQDKFNSCGSKISNPRKRPSQIKRHRNISQRKLNNGFKWSSSSTKKRFYPLVKKQKLLMSSEPSHKALILREMIRLGRKPNRKFEKAARNTVFPGK